MSRKGISGPFCSLSADSITKLFLERVFFGRLCISVSIKPARANLGSSEWDYRTFESHFLPLRAYLVKMVCIVCLNLPLLGKTFRFAL